MDLSPEERKRIYEEEKARIEAREQIEREKREISTETSTGLLPNIAGLLCYIGAWISGIIFFIIEQKNSWVRFHAAQSIITFGTITVAGIVFNLIPIVGHAISTIISIIGLLLWIVLMIKAYKGERYKLALFGDIAEKMAAAPALSDEYPNPPTEPSPPVPPAPPTEPTTPVQPTTPAPPTPIDTTPAADVDLDKQIGRKVEEYFKSKRAGRITGYAFAIAWSIVLLIFFNFFNEYVAYYHSETVGGIVTWTRYPFFTSEISLWLPILTTTLAITILGNIVLISFDRYILHEIITIVINAFGLATVISLLSIFPLDFNVIPDTTIASAVQISVIVVLICTSIGIGIGIMVRAIKFIVNVLRGVTSD